MLAPANNFPKNFLKSLEYKQEETTYEIEFDTNLDNLYLCIKNKENIYSFYELEISFNDIQLKNSLFKIY